MVNDIVGPMTTAEFKVLFLLLATIHATSEYKPRITMRAENTKRDRA